MRPIVLALSMSLVLAGCSSSDEPSPLFGGFAVRDTAAVIMTPGTCSMGGVTASAAAVAVVFTSHAAGCEVLQQTELCGMVASSEAVVAVAIQGDPDGAVSSVAPGTYRFMANPPTGPFRVVSADADQVGAYPACTPTADSGLDFTDGTMWLTTVSTGQVKGSVELRFENQAFQHAFDVAACPVTIDLCHMMTMGCFGHEPLCIDPATLPTTI
jgi:hypothetical protein